MKQRQLKQSQHEILTEARLLLPWYSQGLLDQAQMDWMKIQIDTYPQLLEEQLRVQKESEWLQKQVNTMKLEKYYHDPQRLEALLAKIQQAEQSKSLSNTAISPAFYKIHLNKIKHNIKHYLFPSAEIGLWKAGASLALLVITIQSGLLVQNHLSNTDIQYETLSGENSLEAQENNTLLVSFQKEATMQQVDTLLNQYQLSFIQGPDPAGLYLVNIAGNMDQSTLIKILAAETHIIRFIETP